MAHAVLTALVYASFFVLICVVHGSENVQCKLEVLPGLGASGRPGKRGPDGPKGVKGQKGDGGQEMNQRLIESLVKEGVETAMISFVKDMNKKLETMRQSILSSLPGRCPITYKDKCYWAIFRGESSTNFIEAELLCKEQGGRLGNVVDGTHMENILAFGRNWLPLDKNKILGLWVAAKYDSSTIRVQGSPYVRWRPGYPVRDNSRTHIYISSSDKRSNEGYSNWKSDATSFGVLCENDD